MSVGVDILFSAILLVESCSTQSYVFKIDGSMSVVYRQVSTINDSTTVVPPVGYRHSLFALCLSRSGSISSSILFLL